MFSNLLSANDLLQYLYRGKSSLAVILLLTFWLWETWQPFVSRGNNRLRHGARNLAVALLNAVVLGLVFASFTLLMADWTTRNRFGLLHQFELPQAVQFIVAILLLDAWMYLWHRANHAIPLLWRFHRMHHSDNHMDVTTATRFHVGEHVGANLLRLGLIPLLGLQIWHLVAYETLVIAITQFHHANISLGRIDRWLRLIIVTPDMHKMHHSRWQQEADSNFSTFFSIWDRLARSFRMRTDLKSLEYGLNDFDEPSWQTFWGMLKTPFSEATQHGLADTGDDGLQTATRNAWSPRVQSDAVTKIDHGCGRDSGAV